MLDALQPHQIGTRLRNKCNKPAQPVFGLQQTEFRPAVVFCPHGKQRSASLLLCKIVRPCMSFPSVGTTHHHMLQYSKAQQLSNSTEDIHCCLEAKAGSLFLRCIQAMSARMPHKMPQAGLHLGFSSFVSLPAIMTSTCRVGQHTVSVCIDVACR